MKEMIQKKMQETGSLISVRNAHLLVVKRMLIEKKEIKIVSKHSMEVWQIRRGRGESKAINSKNDVSNT